MKIKKAIIKKVLYIVVIAILFNCSENKNHSNNSKITLICDKIYQIKGLQCFEIEIESKLVKRWYENDNNEKHGYEYEFYENGNFKSIFKYKDNILNGVQKLFHKNGNIETTIIYKNGIRVGDSYMYYQDGLIKNYRYFLQDQILYIVFYDKNERVYNEEGELIVSLAYEKKLNKMYKSGDLNIDVYYVNPPHGTPDISIFMLNENGDTLNYIKPDIDTTYFNYRFLTNSPGLYKYTAVLKMITNEENVITEDINIKSDISILLSDTNTYNVLTD